MLEPDADITALRGAAYTLHLFARRRDEEVESDRQQNEANQVARHFLRVQLEPAHRGLLV